ncbi:gamma carbonic anhydrase family protein [Thermoplasmatales archaeon ex4572_165]|nr:MAG: gamma carbonic anhydrase family protein [Thermoplasmatales archaeon ex4572_165]RLF58825.1 MAG: gamma carbonic anhydrase family protein [Thermoplasmata archaeon]
MSIYAFENKQPTIGEGSFIYESADVIGNVKLGKNCYIGPGARIRGDYGTITIGDNTAIEENVVIHARPNDITVIGSYVTIGHAAIIHNATINDWAVIGMGSIVSDWAEIGQWAVVAEGAVVKNKQKIPDKSIAVGIPAKIISETTPEYEKQWTEFKNVYVDLARERLPNSLKKIK